MEEAFNVDDRKCCCQEELGSSSLIVSKFDAIDLYLGVITANSIAAFLMCR